MDTVINYLKQLNLSDVEAKLYLRLLQTGPSSVRDLAETTEMKRTTAYFYIDQLIEKGLILKLVKGTKKLVAANDPESLQILVSQKVETAKAVEKAFPDVLKTLMGNIRHEEESNDAEIQYYKGVNGARKIYEEALSTKELCSYVNISDIEGIFPQNLFSFDTAIQKNKDLIIHELVEESEASRKQVKLLSQNTRYKAKFLPKDLSITSSDILLYDGKVAIINVRDKISGVILHNKDYYNISKELFNYMWRLLPEIEK